MKKIYFSAMTSFVVLFTYGQNWINGGNTLSTIGTIGTNSNNSLVFETAGIERGRITNAGNWGIGSLGTSSRLTINTPVNTSPLRTQIGGITAFAVNANGSVSIGTVTPGSTNGLYVTGQTGLGGPVNTALQSMLQVRQSSANRGIQVQHEYRTDYWTTGIGTSTFNFRFEYNGIAKGQVSSIDGAYTQISDRSLKQDIEAIEAITEKVMQLKPSTYYLKESRNRAAHKSVGLIAQEVEQVFPELVYEVDGNLKSLNYSALSIVAIKAIQEQQEIITRLTEEMEDLKSLVRELRGQSLEPSKGWIKQNSPNPVSVSTTIQYSISPEAKAARILITNAKGQQVKIYMVIGSGTVNFAAGTLSSGTYTYSLIVDGKTVSSKKLVIAR